jgi:hypothetical protein
MNTNNDEKRIIETNLRDPTECVPPSHFLRTETDAVSEALSSLVFRISDDGQCSKTH